MSTTRDLVVCFGEAQLILVVTLQSLGSFECRGGLLVGWNLVS